MQQNRVSITASLSQAVERTRRILFGPFELNKWLAIGFTAWLAGAGAGGGCSTGFNFPNRSWTTGSGGSTDAGPILEKLPAELRWSSFIEWLLDHPVWLGAAALGCLFLITVILVVLWLASRGQFMFLHNVVHDRAEVVRPWSRYAHLANSHFGFRLALIGGTVLVVGALVTAVVVFFTRRGGPPEGVLEWLGLIGAVLLVCAVILVAAYVQYFLDGFVVPVMARYDLKAMPAWGRFAEIFRRHPWRLLLSGPFLVVLGIGVQAAVFVVGLLTCCLGFLLLAIPYVGTVALLPVLVAFRSFTVILLDQIEPGFLPAEAAPPSLESTPSAE